MQMHTEEIAIFAYIPDDESESTAIKVLHRTSRQEAINQDTDCQWQNFRRAAVELLTRMNPNPDHIPIPPLMLHDRVRVSLPQSVHEGRVTRLSWDYRRLEWQYFVQCPNNAVSTWYIAADLHWLDPDEDDKEMDEIQL